MRTCLATASVCTVLLAGCGATRTQDAEHKVRQLVASYEAALISSNAALACADMSSSLQRKIVQEAEPAPSKGASCERVMSAAFSLSASALLKAIRQTRITGVRVNGRHAAVFSGRAGQTLTTEAIEEGGVWKLATSPSGP